MRSFFSEKPGTKNELFMPFWETFNFSQGLLDTQQKMFTWMAGKKVIRKPFFETVPEGIYLGFHSPKKHNYAGQEAEKEKKEVILRIVEKIVHHPNFLKFSQKYYPQLGKKFTSLINNKIQSADDLGNMVEFINTKDLIWYGLTDEEITHIKRLKNEIQRRVTVKAAWDIMIQEMKKTKKLTPEQEWAYLDDILVEMVQKDRDYVFSGRPKRDATHMKKADDDNDPHASFIRRYIINEEPAHSREGNALLSALRAHWKNNAIRFQGTDTINRLKESWERHHPGEKFYQVQE